MKKLAVVLIALAGCGPADMPCTEMPMPGDLAQRAQLMRLDVYEGTVHCDGASVPTGAPPPTMSKAAAPGQPIHLDIPSGAHTLLLSAFGDTTGNQLLATACTETSLAAGASVCFNLTLVEIPDMALNPDARAMCSTSPDDCPVGQYCAVDGQCAIGCKNAGDCMGGGMAVLCDVAAHRCVECLGQSDCPPGKKCSPSGACVMGCDVSAGANCPGAQMCCSDFCIDTRSDISSCGSCGRACGSTNVATPSCTNNLCTPACTSGWGDCNRPVSPNADDGCETNLHDVTHCGGCNTVCTLAHAAPKCPGGTCQVQSCDSGFFDCDANAASGCECAGIDLMDGMKGCCPGGGCQAVHSTGLGQTFNDCTPLGTFNEQLAREAAAAYPLANPDAAGPFKNTCLDGEAIFKRNVAQNECAAWGFSGMVKGRVVHVNTNCVCPSAGGLTWQ